MCDFVCECLWWTMASALYPKAWGGYERIELQAAVGKAMDLVKLPDADQNDLRRMFLLNARAEIQQAARCV